MKTIIRNSSASRKKTNILSGKRDSDPRPSAWEADALPTELLPLFNYYKNKKKLMKLTSFPKSFIKILKRLSLSRDLNPRPAVYETAALPTELKRQFFTKVEKTLSIFMKGST